ncbi:MAG: hypothetical protein K8I82_03180 [Anaerolineae bacterium]|nr:hypothetical protein [Anaerolineae bacterium]
MFQYHPDILSKFPDVVGGVILGRGLSNPPTPDALKQRFFDEQKAVLEKIGSTPLSEIESLEAWRRTFSAFGVKPTQYRSAAEALLRRLTKQGDIPSINTLVDIGNLVSIRYALPVAVLDTRQIQGVVTVHFATGTERYITLGTDEVENPPTGEVIFSDETGHVVARRWCWRQSDTSAARENTENVIITVESQHKNGRAAVENALRDLLELLPVYTGGTFESMILEAAK